MPEGGFFVQHWAMLCNNVQYCAGSVKLVMVIGRAEYRICWIGFGYATVVQRRAGFYYRNLIFVNSKVIFGN